LYRLSVSQYHAMIDAGVLKPGAKVELVEGLLIRKPMTRKPIHDATIDLLGDRLRGLLPPAWIARDQKALTLVRGEPEPDLAVVLGPYGRYLDHHPAPAEIGLVIEVSDTTLRTDRGPKLVSYARAGIPVYWVVNLVAGEVEVHTDPHAPAKRRPKYRSRTVYLPGQVVPVVLAGAAVGTLAVSDIIR
jgi:Uma2 family endonuclease